MTIPRNAVLRPLGLAVARLACTDPAALDEARDLIIKALFEVEGLRAPRVDPVRDVIHELLAPSREGV